MPVDCNHVMWSVYKQGRVVKGLPMGLGKMLIVSTRQAVNPGSFPGGYLSTCSFALALSTQLLVG